MVTNLSKLKAALACKIFDAMISPILTYNSEIWGVYANQILRRSQIQTALGRLPLNITIDQKIFKYILYSQSTRNVSFVKQSFLMSFDLHCNGKNSFHFHLMDMSEYFNLPDFNPDLLDTAMVKSCVSSMKQEYISTWQNTLKHSQKL